jgi:hypothetical protein
VSEDIEDSAENKDESTGSDENAGVEGTDTEQVKTEVRSLYRHPLAAVGGALVLAGLLGFVVLAFVDLSSSVSNPYRGLVTFIGFPVIVLLGVILFAVAIRIQVIRARKRGERIRFNLRVEPSSPRYMRSLAIFGILSAVLVGTVAWGGFKGYEVTDSASFCGESCHTVMEPEWVTYQLSPHAKVACAQCHIGPGASFFVRSKIDGLRQVWKTITNTYDRPIATPVTSLRPAQETCEGCHWPEQFYGDKLVTKTYFRTDENNTPWTISLAVKIGGGDPRTGQLEGIHWHMLGSTKIEYATSDPKRQEIFWVRMTDRTTGEVTEYRTPDAPTDLDTPGVEVRTLDCIDCHNRPSHDYRPPATAINLEMTKGTISSDLPFVRWEGLNLLNAAYQTKAEADDAIQTSLEAFYAEKYPNAVDQAEVEQAAETLVKIYNENFFPEMKTDYRSREDNLNHFTNDGCFRCHFSELQTYEGTTISSECDSCHLITAQGQSENLADLDSSLSGLEFQHPVPIGGAWKVTKCTTCHTPEQGY